MNQQKGFSLTEVLTSLLLVTTLALVLLQQQLHNRQLLKQLILRAENTQFLNQIEKSLCVRIQKLPLFFSNHLAMKQKTQEQLNK